jgi:predicted O-methyltransferase YrrM
MIDGDQTLGDDLARFVRAVGPEHTPVQAEMAAFAAEQEFPNIGPDAGAVLRLLARLVDAETVFEFGSGFGYSASWFLRGGAGRVILTEFDGDELERGREFLSDAGLTTRCVFEEGDAMEIVDRYGGPFDVVLIDHQKSRYADAFEAVRAKLSPGGVVVADNVTRGPADFDATLAHLEDDAALPADDPQTTGIGTYLDTVRADESFESLLLPVGSGLCVSTKVE